MGVLCDSENERILPDEVSANMFQDSYVKLINAIILKHFYHYKRYLTLLRNSSFVITGRATWWWVFLFFKQKLE